MIADVQDALRELLYTEARLPRDALDIRFATPTSSWVSSLTRPTLNFFLFDLHENAALRSMEFHSMPLPGQVSRTLAPRRIDLKYLVTVFFKSQVEELGRDEWNVLWRVLGALLRQEEWDTAHVPAAVRALDLDLRGVVSNAPNQTNYSLFSSLGLPVRPHLTYALTVPLDLNVTNQSPLTLERQISLGEVTGPGEPRGLQVQGAERIVRSSWRVRLPDGTPAPEALVRANGSEVGFTDATGTVHLRLPREDVRELHVLTRDGQSLSIDPGEAFVTLPSPN
ncbi:DUF4255 domain-containing protein [Deinococcus enclensis]|uniref:Pvc16 N-terminal domain-containing protein n=1 Tax=Deinococcus enclensis TaxID=1049582 RepID=A0ABT9MH97_9DEIO|nr:DUF4255 domain-containing protein [Deinococcus enclensis]MDP9765960.1 hypothetical protein [Deinococcus enclensis]